MPYKYDSLNRIQDSLNATGVLSEDYKRFIMGWAFSVASEAYAQGVKDEKERHA